MMKDKKTVIDMLRRGYVAGLKDGRMFLTRGADSVPVSKTVLTTLESWGFINKGGLNSEYVKTNLKGG